MLIKHDGILMQIAKSHDICHQCNELAEFKDARIGQGSEDKIYLDIRLTCNKCNDDIFKIIYI